MWLIGAEPIEIDYVLLAIKAVSWEYVQITGVFSCDLGHDNNWKH